MKKFSKLLALAILTLLAASVFTLGVSAVNTEAGADPNNLKPGSETVIFIKDAERNENHEVVGELSGDGTGSDAENPLKASDHEKFDPSAERKRYDYTTAFYQATELLEKSGGTIVICGPVYLGIMECADNGASAVRDAYTAKFGNNVIKFTSVYNGVDYRETAGAKLTIATPAMVTVLGSSIWENIDIETTGTDRAITFDDYCTLVGEGVKCYPSDPAFNEVAQNYVSLGAGHRHAGSKNENPTLTVKSGTYNKITGAMWGTTTSSTSENTNTYLTLEGTTSVLGLISGTVQAKSNFSGNVNITINGGYYECDINGVGPTGMLNTDGLVNLKINGGTFTNGWSINQAAMNATNNMPAKTTLDFSGWNGDKLQLAYAFNLVTDITDIKLPAGVTADELVKLAQDTPPGSNTEDNVPEETTAPATQPSAAATEADETEAKATEAEKQETNAPETTVAPTENSNNSGNLLTIILIIAIVILAAVVIILLVKKKK